MSERDNSEKTPTTRPSIKVSLPVELYYRRMRRLEEEAYLEDNATKKKEEGKNAEEKNPETKSCGRQKGQTKEQKQSDVKHRAPPVNPSPGYLGIPVGSYETPRPVRYQSYPWSINRPHPYRNHAARVQTAQRFRDSNNNITGQRQGLMPGHRENWQQPPVTNVPTTQYGPKFN